MNPLTQNTKNFYLPSLDGLRFLAFLMIFLFHAYIRNDYTDNLLLEIVQRNTWFGVDLFFVLSGFLITSLLLLERKKYGHYSIKKFIIRRTLRIWPLFYLAIFTAAFIIPLISSLVFQNYSDPKFTYDIKNKIPFHLVFLGNWSMIFQGFTNFRNLANLWTIAVEEQFYLSWPFILLFLTNFKRLCAVICLIIAISIIYKYNLALSNASQDMIFMNTLARLDTILSGCLLASIYIYKPDWIKKLSKFTNSISLFFAFILFMVVSYFINPTHASETLSVAFGFFIIALIFAFIVHCAIQVKVFRNFLSLKYLVFLGKISYGLYVWHIFVINFFLLAFSNTTWIKYAQPLELIITIIVGITSYYLYETQFLRLKDRFAKIKTRKI